MTFQPSRRLFMGGAAACALAAAAGAARAAAGPPVAKVEPVTDRLWGETIVDPYRWMEDAKDPDWTPFLQGQAAYARTALDALPGRKRMLERVAAMSGDILQATYPKPVADRVFYEKREPGQAKPNLVVRFADGAERVLADPERFGPSAVIDWWEPAPDGRHLAFGVSSGGSEASTGHVVRVEGARLLPDRIADAPYAAVSWLPDGTGFFYNRFAGRPVSAPDYYNDRSVYLHRVGTAQADDVKIMAPGFDPAVPMRAISSPEIQNGVGSAHVALLVRDGYVRDFDLYIAERAAVLAGRAGWRRVARAADGVADFAMSGPDLFLTLTDGSPRGRLVKLDARSGDLASATPVRAQEARVIDELNAGRGGTFVTLNDGGEQSLVFIGADGRETPVAIPFTGWMQSVAVNATDGRALVRATSWLEPAAVFAVDPATGAAPRTALQPPPRIDLSPYESRRLYATAKDGMRIPISLVARRGSQARGPAPCLVHAYGAYQWPSQPNFIAREVAFLEAGGIIATAHVRGGGEYGRAWHEAGMKANKPNTWRDLIACCEHLVAEGWTTPGRLAVEGGSAGGITVGRALTERPDLFAAVISKVGMSNPLRAEFEPNGQPNVPEFGSVKTQEGFAALKAMDSYHAVQDGVRYPAVLLETGVNDARVEPYNAAKMAARLQAANPTGVTLLRVEFDSGHVIAGRSKGSVDQEFADDFAFILAHIRPTA
jgi:prolyl oligopeptidase